MPTQEVFQPLSPSEIANRLDAIKSFYQLVAFTLLDGDLILGGLSGDKLGGDDVVTVAFNSTTGKPFGNSHVVEIPKDQIADIQLVPLGDNSIPRIGIDDPQIAFLRELGIDDMLKVDSSDLTKLSVKDYPNPLATIICNNNMPVIDQHKLTMFERMEKALSLDAIPPEGIEFDNQQDFLLYADWDYFLRRRAGDKYITVGTPVVGVGKYLAPSLVKEAISILRVPPNVARLDKIVSADNISEHRTRGRVMVPMPHQTTSLEGQECLVVICANSDNENAGPTLPVLVKQNHLKIPLEFLSKVTSVLMWYGELLPFPVKTANKVFNKVLLARAVAHLRA